MANIRAAYAEVSADVLTDPQSPATETDMGGYKITYDGTSKTYTATITATQKDNTKWEGETPNIGGKSVAAAGSWTVTGNVANGTVTIA